jgi:hypothetical protein
LTVLVCTRCSGKLEANSISGNVQMVSPTLDSVQCKPPLEISSLTAAFEPRHLHHEEFQRHHRSPFSSSVPLMGATSLKGDVINQATFKPDTHGSPHPASK